MLTIKCPSKQLHWMVFGRVVLRRQILFIYFLHHIHSFIPLDHVFLYCPFPQTKEIPKVLFVSHGICIQKHINNFDTIFFILQLYPTNVIFVTFYKYKNHTLFSNEVYNRLYKRITMLAILYSISFSNKHWHGLFHFHNSTH